MLAAFVLVTSVVAYLYVLNSNRFFLFPQVTAYHGRVEAVDLTAYDTQEHLLYHAEVRW